MTTDEKAQLARWLKTARKAAGFSNAQKFLAAVKEQEGSAPSYSTYAQWESGEVGAREESLAPIRRFHESRKSAPALTPAPDLATALQALAAELRAAREGRDAADARARAAEERAEAQARAIETLGARVKALEDAASPARRAPRG
jgi:transcriptional regulator with XRE-family HTH domain